MAADIFTKNHRVVKQFRLLRHLSMAVDNEDDDLTDMEIDVNWTAKDLENLQLVQDEFESARAEAVSILEQCMASVEI